MNIWIYALIVAAGYLLGSINVAIMYIKRRYGVDVRTEGSGNAGATNVARTHGLGAGLLTLGSDMLKTALAGFLGWKLGGSTGLAVACAAALTGHCFPVYYGFRGGKGVSASACIALLLDWRFFLLLLALLDACDELGLLVMDEAFARAAEAAADWADHGIDHAMQLGNRK